MSKQKPRGSPRSITPHSTNTSEIVSNVDRSFNEMESFAPSLSLLPPNRRIRQLEKETLSNLNDRLAVYIDKVRQLELENERLNVRINETETVERKERSDLMSRYEMKIKDLRDLLDETLKEKTRLDMDTKTALAERDDMRYKICKLEKDLKQVEKARLGDESLIKDLQGRLHSSEGLRRSIDEENKNLSLENADYKRQLEVLRRQVEDEALANTALANQSQSLHDDYEFLKKTYEGQLEEIHRKRHVEMTTTAREMERTYEFRLQEQLVAMRAEFDGCLNRNRRDIDETFKNKMNEANEARQQAIDAKEEAAGLRLRVHTLEKSNNTYEGRMESLNKRILDLENELRYVREDYEVRIKQRDGRIADLQNEIDRLLVEYQDLFELKVQLDTELKAYQSLLEGEETRLNISSQTSPGSHLSVSDASSRRGVKRKRFAASDDSFYFQNTAKTFKTTANSDCDIEIESHDVDGKFVKLTNKSDDAISIGQWAIKSAGGERETVYKFHSRQSLKSGDSICVWSADSGEKHSPPSQLVMKNQQWPSGDRIRTILVDADGVEMAARESVAEFQRGHFASENGHDPDQRCSIM